MKIAIGYKLNDGPWGGGNQFAISLKKKLVEEGHEVFFNLSRNDLDIILLTDPRKRSSCVSFSSGDIIKYLIFKNSTLYLKSWCVGKHGRISSTHAVFYTGNSFTH